MRSLLLVLGRFAFPAAILIAAFVLVYVSGTIPSALDWLRLYGPYFMFAIGAALAAIFNRGRSLFALITLVTAYAAHQWWLQEGLTTPSARAVYLALTVFVPVNLGFAALLSERGVSNRHSVLYFAILAVEIAFAAWVIAYGRTDISEWGLRKFVVPAPFAIGAIPQTGIVALLLALVVSMAAAFALTFGNQCELRRRDRRFRRSGARSNGVANLLDFYRGGRADDRDRNTAGPVFHDAPWPRQDEGAHPFSRERSVSP